MPRPLRFVPANSVVEITTRTLQGRLLLRPSSELTEIILGVIGKAQDLYQMSIYAFVVLGTHAHLLLSPPSAEKLARFMQFVNANIAKEAGRLRLWRERLWSRRYRSIVVARGWCARVVPVTYSEARQIGRVKR
jgi:REP element-mobilizing transposase RayT